MTDQVYRPAQRALHWIIALMIFTLIPVGIWMSNRGEANLWDGLTNSLYSWHKLFGFTALLLIVTRIVVKLRATAPPYPASMTKGEVSAAHAVHGLIYLLMLIVPLAGWAGVTAFPALVTVGGYNLPPMPFVPVNRGLAETFFFIHKVAAISLAVLALGHIAAALRHLIVKKDGVFQRMWPR
jgi:cytochrome b561